MSKCCPQSARALNDAEVAALWCIRLTRLLARLLPFVEMSDGNVAAHCSRPGTDMKKVKKFLFVSVAVCVVLDLVVLWILWD
jgi:hypothetical protein